MKTSFIRFIEKDRVPKDAVIVDHTWQFVNNDGTPDKRFNKNRKLPVCLYGKVCLKSESGLNIELQASSEEKAKRFAELLQKSRG